LAILTGAGTSGSQAAPPPPATGTGHHPTGSTNPAPAARRPALTDCILTGAITSGDLSHTQTVNGLPVPASCATTNACPGLTACCGTWYSDIYTYTNLLDTPQCITITINASGCAGTMLFSAAYLTSFDPNDPCANYLGDVGYNG